MISSRNTNIVPGYQEPRCKCRSGIYGTRETPLKLKFIIWSGTFILLIIHPDSAWTNLKDDVGLGLLTTYLDGSLPVGAGVMVTQVEAPSDGHWMPDTSAIQFSGKTITDRTGGDTGYSSHATDVSLYYYGQRTSDRILCLHREQYREPLGSSGSGTQLSHRGSSG